MARPPLDPHFMGQKGHSGSRTSYFDFRSRKYPMAKVDLRLVLSSMEGMLFPIGKPCPGATHSWGSIMSYWFSGIFRLHQATSIPHSSHSIWMHLASASPPVCETGPRSRLKSRFVLEVSGTPKWGPLNLAGMSFHKFLWVCGKAEVSKRKKWMIDIQYL